MLVLRNVNYDGEILLRKTGLATVILFSLIVFQSKALINVLGALAIFLSIGFILLYDRKVFRSNPYLLLFVVPFGIGFLLAFLSNTGAMGALEFLTRFKFMLLILPLAVFVKEKRDLHLLLGAFTLSAIVAVVYGIYSGQGYASFRGFHIIGRTADMMTVAFLATLAYSTHSRYPLAEKPTIFKCLLLPISGLFAWALLMSEMRGSWLGAAIGCILLLVVLLFLHRKALIFIVAMVIMISSVVYFTNIGGVKNNISRINHQVESMVDTEDNHSNNARLHLWRTGWDFSKQQFMFGTGAKKSLDDFMEFFMQQPEDYQKKYSLAPQYADDYHNSYLQIHIETGFIFILVFISSILYTLFILMKNVKKVKFNDQKYLLAAVVASVAFMITQVFHSDLYHYGSTAFYLVLFSGCYILNKNDPSVWIFKRSKI